MVGSLVTLARWLGPWANGREAPHVRCIDDVTGDLRVRVFAPHGPVRRTFMIAPGLHYAGADDRRLDRFCKILAAAGNQVIAPFIPDYLALRPSERAKHDFARVLDALPRWRPIGKPIVFSISFGSLLAFALAAERGAELDRLVVFGGYADLRQTLAFCLTGEVAGGRTATRDPLNQPVVLMNLLHLIDCADREAVATGWQRYVRRTWGRPEMKAPERFAAVADELAATVPDRVRELFRIGVGVLPGAADLARAALARFDATALDPAPYLPRIANRVDLVHGVDDDVIPYEHSFTLARALPKARVHVTGLYGHTGAARLAIGTAARELATMVRVLHVLAR